MTGEGESEAGGEGAAQGLAWRKPKEEEGTSRPNVFSFNMNAIKVVPTGNHSISSDHMVPRGSTSLHN